MRNIFSEIVYIGIVDVQQYGTDTSFSNIYRCCTTDDRPGASSYAMFPYKSNKTYQEDSCRGKERRSGFGNGRERSGRLLWRIGWTIEIPQVFGLVSVEPGFDVAEPAIVACPSVIV